MFKSLKRDIDAVFGRDPAVRSRLEVILCYPGFHAIMLYRLAHAAWRRDWLLLGRFLSHVGRLLTGIEIHPGARIGHGLFIDHGLGVVIGETAELGENVTLYHDVTLGGISPHQDAGSQANQKRHPTLEDNVVVGSGAQILGPISVGRCARVGANAVVLKDVPEGVTVVGVPARVAVRSDKPEDEAFAAYGTPSADLPDPVSRAIDGLLSHVAGLEKRIDELEGRELEADGSEDVDSTRKRTAPKRPNC